VDLVGPGGPVGGSFHYGRLVLQYNAGVPDPEVTFEAGHWTDPTAICAALE
jgi:hypothetical protein